MKITRFNHVREIQYGKGLINIFCYPEHYKTDLWNEYYFLNRNHELVMHFSGTSVFSAKQLSSKSENILVRKDVGEEKDRIQIIQVSDTRPTHKVLHEVEGIDVEIFWDSHEDDNDSSFAIQKNGKWGFIDYNGEEIIKPQYVDYCPFNNEIACVCKNGKWGYINKQNEIIIPFNYDMPALEIMYSGYSTSHKFNNKLIVPLAKNEKFGIIDTEENIIIPFEYEYIWGIGKYICAQKDGKAGIIDFNNNVILPFEYDDIHLDDDNLPYYYLEKNNLTGLYDFEQKQMIIPVEYEVLSAYENAVITKKENSVLLSRKDFTPVTEEFKNINYAGSGIFEVKNNDKVTGFITQTGEFITPVQYDYRYHHFKDGICIAEYKDYNRGYDIINTKGEVLYHTGKFKELFYAGDGYILTPDKNGEYKFKKLI